MYHTDSEKCGIVIRSTIYPDCEILRRVILVTDQESKIKEAPQTDPAQVGTRLISRTTLISAIVVLAAIALLIILATR